MIASSMFIGKHILLYHLMDTLPSLTEIFEILFVKIFEMKSLNKTGRSAWRNSCILSNIFPAGEGGFGQMMYRSPERSPQDSQDGFFFCTVPRPHFLGRALIWPGYFGEHVLGLFGLYPSSLSKSVGFVSLSGKASLVSISVAILFLRSWHVYFPLEFEFRGKSCVE